MSLIKHPRGPAAFRVRLAVIAGGFSGLAGGLVFATAHALLIVPIWNRMAFGLTSAAAAGLAAGWAFVELGFEPTGANQPPPRGAYAAAGLRFGALLWLAVVPVTLADTILRLTGVGRRYELIAVAVAIGLAIGGGLLLGSRLAGTRRAMIAAAAATLLLTVAMAGPVPLPNGRRAVAIFLSVLPACMIGGLVLGLAFRGIGARYTGALGAGGEAATISASGSMAITLQTATPSDAGDIASFLSAAWAVAYGSLLTPDALSAVARAWHHPDGLRRQMSDPRVAFLLARTGAGALVGVATVKQSDDARTVSVLRLYVLREYQGQGIGTQLLNRALAAFPGAQRIELQVAEGNPAGLSFWTKRGFRACGHDEARIGDITLALISMERTIAA